MKAFIKKYFVLILSLISSAAAIYLGFYCFSKEEAGNNFVNYTWYLLAAALFLFVQKALASVDNWRLLKEKAKKHAFAMLLAAALIILMSFACKPEFRILADETNLASEALAMYETGESKVITQTGRYFEGMRDVIAFAIGQRPAFYPFLVSIMHTVCGYRVENAFYINLMAGCASLFLIYLLVYYVFGRFWGVIAMLLSASYPLFVLCSASGALEPVNLAMALFCAVLARKFILAPNALNLEVLLLILPLLSQTRYESVTAVFCVFLIFPFLMPKNEYSRLSPRLVIYPFLFLPVAWQRMFHRTAESFLVDNIAEPFSVSYLKTNLSHAFDFFMGYRRESCMAPITAFLCAAGAAAFFYFAVKKRKQLKKTDVFMAAFVGLFYLFHSLARFCFHMGNLELALIMRMGLIYVPLIVFFAVYFLAELSKSLKKPRTYMICLALASIIFYWGAAGQNLNIRTLVFYRGLKIVERYLSKYLPDKQDYVLVTSHPTSYVPYNYSVINYDTLKNSFNRLCGFMSLRSFGYIVAVQHISTKTLKPIKGYELPKETDECKKILYEAEVTPEVFIRISAIYPNFHPKSGVK